MNKSKIYVVGVGPGDPRLISERAKLLIADAELLIGGRRHLDQYLTGRQRSFAIGNNLSEVVRTISELATRFKICVMASGDTGLYSIANYLVKKLENIEIELVPGISAYQYFCAKLKLPWHDVKINSVHGCAVNNLYKDVAEHRRTIFFTGSNCPAQQIAKLLLRRGLTDYRLTVGENLSYDNEQITSGTVEEIAQLTFDSLSMMLVEQLPRSISRQWPHYPIGIADSAFIRAKVPMTKAEVRAVTMSKLQLNDELVIYDIGGGSGSVAIECAMLAKASKVITIERKAEAVALIKQNIAHFNLTSLDVIEALAPCDISGYPAPDRVFIGGTAGNMPEIISWLKTLTSQCRVVINAVTIETVYQALEQFKTKGFHDVEIVQLAVSIGQPVGQKHLMKAHNPIYIISANYTEASL